MKIMSKLLGVRKVIIPAFAVAGEDWHGFEAIVKSDDGRKFYIPLFGVWKKKDAPMCSYYYESDTNGLTWRYLTEVKEHALKMAAALYGESK
jgi:hypothetical protein